MSQRAWSEADLSAYLDGELGPEERTVLEADMAQDPALQRRVEALRQTIALVQAMPLRESPRNYLLTPSMVAEPKRAEERRPRRRPMLFFMRLATALSAAAFVIVVGLQLGLGVGLVADVASVERQVEMTQEAEAPMMLEMEETGPPPAGAVPEETEIIPGEPPSWEELPSEEGDGVGGGTGVEEEPQEAPVEEAEEADEEPVTLGADSAETPTAQPTPPPVEEEAEVPRAEAEPTPSPSPERTEEKLAPEITPTPTPTPTPMVEPVRVLEPEEPAPVSEPESEAAFWRWLTVLLGVSTLALGGTALWLSRHR